MLSAHDASAQLRTIRYDAGLLDKLRSKIIAKLHADPDPEDDRVPIAEDAGFAADAGTGLQRVSNEALIRLCIEETFGLVHKAKNGRTGIRELDEKRSFTPEGLDAYLKRIEK